MPIHPPFDLLIVVLLIVFGGFFLFGFAFGRLSPDRTRRQSKLTQLPQSIVLVACALIWWLAAARGTPLETFSRCIFLGMSLGFAGDVIMGRLFPLGNRVIWGMLAFGAGHVFYVLACREVQILFSLNDQRTLVIFLVVGFVVSVGTWMGLVRVPEGNSNQNTASLFYGLLLGGMAAYAAALASQMPALLPLAAGAILFLFSDIMLGNHIFRRNNWYLVGDVIWFTYILGQGLIVFTNSTALTLLP
jgi:hypothetical protein